MTGQDFQDKLDAIVADLQTTGKGKTVNILMRGTGNASQVFPLSSDIGGVITASELARIQNRIDELKPFADTYETERQPVSDALEVFNTERAGHQVLIDAASAAREALNTALEADADYQTAKTALDNARANANYISAVEAYRVNNVSENFGNLGDAKGKYVA